MPDVDDTKRTKSHEMMMTEGRKERHNCYQHLRDMVEREEKEVRPTSIHGESVPRGERLKKIKLKGD